MAEGSAHLTELPFNSKHTPSFFDIIAADALNSSLFSAYNRLAKVRMIKIVFYSKYIAFIFI